MDESSLDSVIVIISLEIINSSASNHLDSKLLQFQAHSQTTLVVDLEPALVLLGLDGTVCQLSKESATKA